MGHKAAASSSNKIIAVASNKASLGPICVYTICSLPTTDNVNVFFDDVVDCPTFTHAEFLNGNTYECVWDGGGGRWVGDATLDGVEHKVWVDCEFGTHLSVAVGLLSAAHNDFFGIAAVTDLPQTVNNVTDCGLPLNLYGEDGYATVSVA